MAHTTSKPKAGFDRCAVCKIDLKGRFVYVDERVEALLGHSKDDLFGRAITNFVDARTTQLIERLLEERNHYETFFDYAPFTLVNPKGVPTEVATVVSLNFIAGNPVNFQLVFRTPSPNEDQASSATDFGYRDLFEGLLRSEGFTDMKTFLRVLVNCCGATAAYAYQIEQETLVPRSGATLIDGSDLQFDSIPAPTKLHEVVAKTGIAYSYADQKTVTEAIERDGNAACEYVARGVVEDDPRYVIRLIFPEETPMEKADRAVAIAEAAMKMAGCMADKTRTINSDDPEVDVKFTVGFLDALHMGAILTAVDGSIIGYNASATRILEGRRPEGSMDAVLESLLDKNGESIRNKVTEYFKRTDEDMEELVIDLSAISGSPRRLTVVRLSVEPEDHSAFFIFQTDENVLKTV